MSAGKERAKLSFREMKEGKKERERKAENLATGHPEVASDKDGANSKDTSVRNVGNPEDASNEKVGNPEDASDKDIGHPEDASGQGCNSFDATAAQSRKQISLLEMFFLFVKIGLVTIGGGYVMIPLLQEEFVTKRKFMNIREFCDIIAIAQTGPGGVAINSSTVVGYQLRGVLGSVVATIGTVMPSFLVIVLLAAWLLQPGNAESISGFMSGATPAVVGLLIAASWSLSKEAVEDTMGFILAVAGFVAVVVLSVHPVLVILGAGVMGFFYYRNRIEPETGACCEFPQVKTTGHER